MALDAGAREQFRECGAFLKIINLLSIEQREHRLPSLAQAVLKASPSFPIPKRRSDKMTWCRCIVGICAVTDSFFIETDCGEIDAWQCSQQGLFKLASFLARCFCSEHIIISGSLLGWDRLWVSESLSYSCLEGRWSVWFPVWPNASSPVWDGMFSEFWVYGAMVDFLFHLLC